MRVALPSEIINQLMPSLSLSTLQHVRIVSGVEVNQAAPPSFPTQLGNQGSILPLHLAIVFAPLPGAQGEEPYLAGLRERLENSKEWQRDVNKVSATDDTALALAVRTKNKRIVQLLLEYNADACQISREVTPWQIAADEGVADIGMLVRQYYPNTKGPLYNIKNILKQMVDMLWERCTANVFPFVARCFASAYEYLNQHPEAAQVT